MKNLRLILTFIILYLGFLPLTHAKNIKLKRLKADLAFLVDDLRQGNEGYFTTLY